MFIAISFSDVAPKDCLSLLNDMNVSFTGQPQDVLALLFVAHHLPCHHNFSMDHPPCLLNATKQLTQRIEFVTNPSCVSFQQILIFT